MIFLLIVGKIKWTAAVLALALYFAYNTIVGWNKVVAVFAIPVFCYPLICFEGSASRRISSIAGFFIGGLVALGIAYAEWANTYQKQDDFYVMFFLKPDIENAAIFVLFLCWLGTWFGSIISSMIDSNIKSRRDIGLC